MEQQATQTVKREVSRQIRDLNSGTFGFVELALDKASGQQVAIKVWKLCLGPFCSAFS